MQGLHANYPPNPCATKIRNSGPINPKLYKYTFPRVPQAHSVLSLNSFPSPLPGPVPGGAQRPAHEPHRGPCAECSGEEGAGRPLVVGRVEGLDFRV